MVPRFTIFVKYFFQACSLLLAALLPNKNPYHIAGPPRLVRKVHWQITLTSGSLGVFKTRLMYFPCCAERKIS